MDVREGRNFSSSRSIKRRGGKGGGINDLGSRVISEHWQKFWEEHPLKVGRGGGKMPYEGKSDQSHSIIMQQGGTCREGAFTHQFISRDLDVKRGIETRDHQVLHDAWEAAGQGEEEEGSPEG